MTKDWIKWNKEKKESTSSTITINGNIKRLLEEIKKRVELRHKYGRLVRERWGKSKRR